MRVVMLLTVAGLAGATAPAALNAQVAGNVHRVSVGAPVDEVGEAPSYDARELRRRMDGAERASERGSALTALRMYESIARDLRAANVLPTEAMWRMATLRFMEGEELAAAAILDELATAASTHGDAVVEVRALVEAAHIYELEGRVSESVTRLDRAFRLLSTAGLPSETQVALLRRVRG